MIMKTYCYYASVRYLYWEGYTYILMFETFVTICGFSFMSLPAFFCGFSFMFLPAFFLVFSLTVPAYYVKIPNV